MYAQRAIAQEVIADISAQGLWPAPIVTQVEPLDVFYPAEVRRMAEGGRRRAGRVRGGIWAGLLSGSFSTPHTHTPAPNPFRSSLFMHVTPPPPLLALLHWVWFSLGWYLQPPPPTHTHTRTRTRAHTHTHTHTQDYHPYPCSLSYLLFCIGFGLVWAGIHNPAPPYTRTPTHSQDYHQDYYVQNPGQGYCRAVVGPKVAKFRQKFAKLIKA